MTTTKAWLADRGVVAVEGEEAASFLQGLLTNDVEALAPGEARYAALLTPQGKILFDMIVVRVPAETGAVFLPRLRGRAGGRSRQAARLLQAARQGRGRRRERRTRRRRGLGERPAPSPARPSMPIRAMRGSAGG